MVLIAAAPPLDDLDLEEPPRRFTNVFAAIVAARVRLRGVADPEERSDAMIVLLDQMRRLAAAQELLVATAPERADRVAAAFVAGTAHQLCLMVEIVAADEERRVAYVDAIRVFGGCQSVTGNVIKRLEVGAVLSPPVSVRVFPC